MSANNDLEKLLFDSSNRTINMVAKTVKKKPEIFTNILALSLDQLPKYSQRASRVVALCFETDPELFECYLPELIRSLPNLYDDAVKRAFLKILMNYPQIDDEELLAILMFHCFQYLELNDETIAVKIYAMEILYSISNTVPDIKNELIAIIEEQVRRGTAAIKVTGQRKLKTLYMEV